MKTGILSGSFAIIVVAGVLFTGNDYLIGVATTAVFFAIWGQSWNVMGGLSNNVSLGHSIFVAVPAYVTVFLLQHYQVPALIGGIAGVTAAIVLAVVVGFATLRLSGPYFTLTTVAVSALLLQLMLHFSGVTGGPNGLAVSFSSNSIMNLEFVNVRVYFLMATTLLILLTAFLAVFKKSRFGYVIELLNTSETLASATGVRVALMKVILFAISAAFTSVGSILYVFYIGFLAPQFLAGLTLSVEICLFAVVGGTRYLYGPIIGAAFYELIDVTTNSLLGEAGGWDTMMLGFVVVALVITEPGGLCALAITAWRRLERLRTKRVDLNPQPRVG